jgi:hypothetical protein|tara:strand:+ start:893 stop:1837 length:945 start_codon:yes stop_codon:yes gene_type:complete
MPRSVFFSQAVRTEQNLYEDLVIESLKIFGQDVYYIPRTLVNRDTILGEDPASKFDDAYLIEAYIENTEGFEGTGDLYSKFGLEIRDEATFVISRRQWEKIIGIFSSDLTNPKPQEGDVLFLPMTNSFFEISFVEDDSPFYQLSNLPVYKLNCSLFEYNDEDFDTGVEGIDLKTGASAYQVTMDLAITGGNHFQIGEMVSQVVGITAAATNIVVRGEVQNRTKTSATISQIGVSNIEVTNSDGFAKDFIVSTNFALIGATSGYVSYVTKIYDINDTTNTFDTDGASQNVAIENFADGFIDFTENNPFGDPSETY